MSHELLPAGVRAGLAPGVPPGTAQLSWHYDLPLHGEEFEFSQGMPFPQTVQYQVVVDAAEGMELEVRGFPDSQPIDYQGRSLLVSEIERTPQSPPLSKLQKLPIDVSARFTALVTSLPSSHIR